MWEQTGGWMNEAINRGAEKGYGYGESLAHYIHNNPEKFPYRDDCVFYNAYTHGVAATYHVTMGTDIIHEHPSVNFANLAALGAKDIRYVGCIGNDWRGAIFKRLLNEIQVSDAYLVTSDSVITAAYCKPIRHGISPVTSEDPRIDFTNLTPISEDVENQVLASLLRAVEDTDILIVCDQFANSCISERMIAEINRIGETIPVIIDSRNRIGLYRNGIVKPNEVEACACLQLPQQTIGQPDGPQLIARKMETLSGHPALVTLGENGAIWCENGECTHVPAMPVQPPIDFVGAGDAFLAGFSLAHIQNTSAETALHFANLVSAITIKKLGITGTATPAEMREALAYYCPNEE